MRIIVDRLEQEDAICELEDGNFRRIPRSLLPGDVREGSVFTEEDGIFLPLSEETEQRRNRISGKLAAIFKKR